MRMQVQAVSRAGSAPVPAPWQIRHLLPVRADYIIGAVSLFVFQHPNQGGDNVVSVHPGHILETASKLTAQPQYEGQQHSLQETSTGAATTPVRDRHTRTPSFSASRAACSQSRQSSWVNSILGEVSSVTN